VKIDIVYISKLLSVFVDANTAHITYKKWEEAGIELASTEVKNKFDEKFLFHIQLIVENNLISNQELESGTLDCIGISFTKNLDCIIDVPIRLTQKGQDFCIALNNKEVLTKLKTELKDAPFKVIFEGSQKLIQHIGKKKIEEWLK